MSEKTRVILRSDGGPEIGMGHFFRTLALARMLREEFQCVFATQHPTTQQTLEINRVCHDVIPLPPDSAHFSAFLSSLTGEEIVVLDNYYFGTDYQRAIKQKGCQLVCIDDIHDKHFVADMVINHATGIDPSHYSADPATRLLLGCEYALLREEFLRPSSRDDKREYAVLLMMGAVDPDDLLFGIAQALNEMELDLPVAVLTGDKSDHVDSLASMGNIRMFGPSSPQQVRSVMSQSTIGILPASTVALEACAVRLPFIVGHFAANQRMMYRGLVDRGLASPLGHLQKATGESIGESVRCLYQDPARRDRMRLSQRNSLDKKSPERLRRSFHDLCLNRM
jgi:UDP-2,4-diacetamido-2,4,6-trideoxy-beta-L-altropyranose hydrolase